MAAFVVPPLNWNDPSLKLMAKPSSSVAPAQAVANLLPFPSSPTASLSGLLPSATAADGSASPRVTPGARSAAANMAAVPVPSAVAPAGLAGMSAVPNLGSPGMTNVALASSAPGARLGVDQAELNRLQQTGSGIDQIKNPWVRGVAKVGDGLLDTVMPHLAQYLPGTTIHHNTLVGQAAGRVNQDDTELQAGATLQDTQSQMQMRNALAQLDLDKGYADLNPKPLPPQSGHIVMSPDGSAAGWQDGNGQLFDLNDPAVPQGARAVAQNMAGKPAKVAPGDEKLTAQEASGRNALWDPLAKQHHIPTGQFYEGMTRADATQMAQNMNSVVGRQQGDTHITVQVQGQQAREAAAAQKTAALDVSDPATAASVQGVANGSLKLQDVFGRGATTAQKAQFVAAVKAVNPNYNSGDHDIENKARSYYTGGGQGGQTLTAFNTAQTHLQILSQASQALNNGNIQLFNKLANSYATATGDSAPTDFNAVKNAVKGEVARALTGHVTVSEQAELDKDLNSDMSPHQVAGVSQKYISLIDGKKKAMQDNYTASQRGQPNFGGGGNGGPPPTPDTHQWSASAWQNSHPGKDVNSATKAAQSAGFQVVK